MYSKENKLKLLIENHGGKISILAFIIGVGVLSWHVLYYSGGINKPTYIPWNVYSYISFGLDGLCFMYLCFDLVRDRFTKGKITRKTFKYTVYFYIGTIIFFSFRYMFEKGFYFSTFDQINN